MARQDVTIRSVSDVFKLFDPFEDARRYYRGVPNENYKLVPKLMREQFFEHLSRRHKQKDLVALQKALLQRFKRYTAPSSRGFPEGSLTDDFGTWLCVAQHHGLPTLLLDWALNPLVALHFAVTGTAWEDTRHGALWSMTLRERDKRQQTTVHLEDSEPLRPNLDHPLIVVPRPFTPRIAAQSGRFTYSIDTRPLDQIPNDGRPPWLKIERWRVGQKSKNKIRAQLRSIGVHDGSLFPDIDGYARYLCEGNL
jgi:hypothetical protein